MKTGTQEAFGLIIIVHPVQTMTALCYKLEFKQMPYPGQGLTISSPNNLGVNSLKGINWHVAANNTWQGIISGQWPYGNIPTKFNGKLKKKYDYVEIRLKEDIWNYLKGYTSFEKCFDEVTNSINQSCHSIFDPNSSRYEKRYLTKTNQLNYI